MSLQCASSPIYRTSAQQKLESKQAAKLYRFGSPKLRDQLREKCRIRVREARQASFGSRRRLATVGENVPMENFDFNEVLRQELAGLESDLQLQEEIYKELRDELNDWFAEQFEAEESYLISVAEGGDSNEVICPICQKFILEVAQTNRNQTEQQLCWNYSCKCGINFYHSAAMPQFRSILRSKLDLHEQQCQQPLNFFLEPQIAGDNKLNAMCEHCDYFCGF